MAAKTTLPYTPDDADPAAQPAPGLRRRLAAMLYEGVILFGVLMLSGLLFGIVAGQRHALTYRHELQAFVFLVLGAYFVWFWIHGGQTLPMKTWHVRLVRVDGRPVTLQQGAVRYVMSWLWFLPALAAAEVLHLHGSSAFYTAILIGMAGYAALTLVLPDRQFLHDRLCQTRLVTWRPAPRRRNNA